MLRCALCLLRHCFRRFWEDREVLDKWRSRWMCLQSLVLVSMCRRVARSRRQTKMPCSRQTAAILSRSKESPTFENVLVKQTVLGDVGGRFGKESKEATQGIPCGVCVFGLDFAAATMASGKE